ncbi:MAG TPA: hypothetical protein DCS63_01655 [Elusimicrobia bacterium]|nr:hypothetical protein [Elusimicrobiota bacterium]
MGTAALIFILLSSALPARAGAVPEDRVVRLSIERFADLAMRNSLRASIYHNSVDLANSSFRSSYLGSRFPQVSLQGYVQRGYNETETSGGIITSSTAISRTYGTQTSANVSMTMPLYLTGGSFSLGLAQSRSLTETSGMPDSTARVSPSWQVSYSQPLFIFTGDSGRRNWRRVQLGHESVVASLDREKLSIWSDSRALYYRTIQQQSTIDVEVQTLKSARELLNITRALTRAGRYAPVELSRAELRYSMEERRIRNARTTLDQELNNIKYFLQLPVDAELLLTTSLEYKKFNWELQDLVDFALDHRQDYLNAQRSLELQKLSLKDAREAGRPDISLNSTYSKTRLLSDPGSPTKTYGWTAQFLATWLLFDSGVNRLRVKQSVIDLENSRITLENARQQIVTEVRNSYLNIKNLEMQLLGFDVNRKQAMNNLKAVRYRYSNGIDRLIDVFDAENDLRQLELESLGLLVSYHSARDQMILSINGFLPGWR